MGPSHGPRFSSQEQDILNCSHIHIVKPESQPQEWSKGLQDKASSFNPINIVLSNWLLAGRMHKFAIRQEDDD